MFAQARWPCAQGFDVKVGLGAQQMNDSRQNGE